MSAQTPSVKTTGGLDRVGARVHRQTHGNIRVQSCDCQLTQECDMSKVEKRYKGGVLRGRVQGSEAVRGCD